MRELASQLGTDPDRPWSRFDARQRRGPAVRRRPRGGCGDPTTRRTRCPRSRRTSAARPSGTASTQAALGRVLLDLTREAPEAARRDRDGQPGRQLEHQPRRLDQQGRRLVRRRPHRLVRRRHRNGAALAGEADRPAHRAGHRGNEPGRPARRARRDLEPLGTAAAADRRRSTTRSSNGRSSRGRSASTRAASRSSWARPPA